MPGQWRASVFIVPSVILHQAVVVVCEILDGRVVLDSNQWELVAVAGCDPGKGNVRLTVEADTKSEAASANLTQLRQFSLSVGAATHETWHSHRLRATGPRFCTFQESDYTFNALVSSGAAAFSGSINMSNTTQQHVWFVLLSTCTNISGQPYRKDDLGSVAFNWQYHGLYNGSYISADVRWSWLFATLSLFISFTIILWRIYDSRAFLLEIIGLAALADFVGSSANLAHLRSIHTTGRPRTGSLYVAYGLDLFSGALLSSILIAMAMRGGHKGRSQRRSNNQAWRRSIAPALYCAAQIALKAHAVPMGDASVYVYLERIRVMGSSPWDAAATCALLAWAVLVTGKDIASCDFPKLVRFSVALLGRPLLRLGCCLVAFHRRPLAGAAGSVLLTGATYAALLQGLERQPLEPWQRLWALATSPSRSSDERAGPLRSSREGLLWAAALIITISVFSVVVLRLNSLEEQLRSLDLLIDGGFAKLESRQQQIEKLGAAVGQSFSFSSLALPSVGSTGDSTLPASAGPPPPPSSLALGSTDGPTFLSVEDLADYPYAGMVAPCLMRYDAEMMPRQRSHDTCAVVGLDDIKTPGMGKFIDMHSTIFRAERCVIQNGRDKDVFGSKTSFCVNFASSKDNDKLRLIVPLKTWRWLLDQGGPLSNLLKQDWKGCDMKLLLTHPEKLLQWDGQLEHWIEDLPFGQQLVGALRNKSIFLDPRCSAKRGWAATSELQKEGCRRIVNLSSSFFAVLLALELCRSVTIFNIAYDMEARMPSAILPAALERVLIGRWVRAGMLRNHVPPEPSLAAAAPALPNLSKATAKPGP